MFSLEELADLFSFYQKHWLFFRKSLSLLVLYFCYLQPRSCCALCKPRSPGLHWLVSVLPSVDVSFFSRSPPSSSLVLTPSASCAAWLPHAPLGLLPPSQHGCTPLAMTKAFRIFTLFTQLSSGCFIVAQSLLQYYPTFSVKPLWWLVILRHPE